MSGDLLKEFGDTHENPWSHVPSQVTASGQGNDEDDFGDFEGPESPKTNLGTQVELGLPDFSKSRHYLSGSENTVSRQDVETSKQPQSASIEETQTPSNDDNEWGDFSGTEVLFDADRLKADESSHWHQGNLHQPQTNKLLAEQPMKVSLLPIESRQAMTPKVKPTQVKPTNLYDFDQAENWEPVVVVQNPMFPKSTTTLEASSTIPKVGVKPGSMARSRDMGPPPSNIPPPSVLLSLSSNLLQALPNDVKNIVTQNRASSDPHEALDRSRVDQMKVALSTTRVAARIIAGRKLRWKRDNLLSQSMKIGPAAKSGGMKLAGVDKLESRREDRETAEALGVWEKQVGPLRSTTSMANVHLPGNDFAIPEISENMPIRVVKPSEGAVTAPKCCFLCGIKRDERVAKVDVNVEDSFGEYWTEHWGHVECVAFWDNHQHSLPHR